MITLGSWPDWIAAAFTSLAFVVAAFSYARDVRVRREAQARLVYSKIQHIEYREAGEQFDLLPHGAQAGNGTNGVVIVRTTPAPGTSPSSALLALVPVIEVTAVIHNGSDELIGPAKIQMVNVGRKQIYDTFSIQAGMIEPKSDHIVSFVWPNADHPGQPALGTTVIFRDASGAWWRRHLSEPIEAVHDDPENAAYTPTERAGWAENARAMGSEPTPDPKLTWRVRWHRFVRTRRGKSPIP